MDKKTQQLGMNPSTASGKLVKDLLWNFIKQSDQNVCFRCSQPMTRETFSIEHKEAWLDSNDPVTLFFDLENIAYSHKRCNYAAARTTFRKVHETPEVAYQVKLKGSRERRKRIYDPAARRAKYLTRGD